MRKIIIIKKTVLVERSQINEAKSLINNGFSPAAIMAQ